MPMLSDGSYYKASDTYIEMCADTLDFYAEGAPLDSGNDPAKGWIKWVFVFVIPLAVASIVCGIFYAQMKTANEQTHANAYMPAEGLALSVVEDTYTHTTETERYDPVKDDSSEQLERLEYRQRWLRRKLGRKNSKLYRSHCRECSTAFSARSVLCAKKLGTPFRQSI